MDFMDATVMFVAGPSITKHFGAGVSDGSWLVLGYELVLCALLIPLSKLAKSGHMRVMLMAGLTAFIFGSLMCFLSESYWLLIAFRVLMGLGASLGVSVFDIFMDIAVVGGLLDPSPETIGHGFFLCAIVCIVMAIASAFLTMSVKDLKNISPETHINKDD